jgi:hypothetical protein
VTKPANPSQERPGDLEVAGALRSGEVRWHERSRTEVRTTGDVETEELSERQGAPDDPTPGKRYRDVRLACRLSARLSDAVRRAGGR